MASKHSNPYLIKWFIWVISTFFQWVFPQQLQKVLWAIEIPHIYRKINTFSGLSTLTFEVDYVKSDSFRVFFSWIEIFSVIWQTNFFLEVLLSLLFVSLSIKSSNSLLALVNKSIIWGMPKSKSSRTASWTCWTG